MAKTLFVHSGMQKTGSTSIQQTLLAASRDVISYADTNPDGSPSANGNNAPFVLALLSKPFVCGSKKYSPDPAAGRQVLKKLASSEAPHHVISAEAISALDEATAVRLTSILSQSYDHLSHVCFVRDPFAYCSSEWQQLLKKYPVYGQRQKQILNYRLPAKRYSRIETLHHQFIRSGESRLFDFKGTIKIKSCVVTAFFEHIGASLPENHNQSPVTNQGLSAAACALLYGLRCNSDFLDELQSLSVNPVQAWKAIVAMANEVLQGPKLAFSGCLLEQLMSQDVIDQWNQLPLVNRTPASLRHSNNSDTHPIDGFHDLSTLFPDSSGKVIARVASIADDPSIQPQHQKMAQLILNLLRLVQC